MDGRTAPDDLTGRVVAQSAIAAVLIELEGHPAHQLLVAPGLAGITAQRWDTTRAQLAALWSDLAAYQGVVAAAGVTDDPDERRALLTGPSVEVGRTVVADGITGTVERIERITLDELVERMDRAFGEVRSMLRECHDRHQAIVSRSAVLAERLHDARALATSLGSEAEAARGTALGTRLHALDAGVAADPLGAAGEPARLAPLAAEIEALAGRIDAAARLRGGWAAELADATESVLAVVQLRRHTVTDHERATATVAGPITQLPPDPARELHSRLAALQRGSWTTRATALAELRAAVDAATRELTVTRELVTGLVERRSELRGRFEAYRAKAVRLGRAEDPEVLALDLRLRDLLWTRPSDLGAATRALAGYRRALAGSPTAHPPPVPEETS